MAVLLADIELEWEAIQFPNNETAKVISTDANVWLHFLEAN
jgi:hypothetical protein